MAIKSRLSILMGERRYNIGRVHEKTGLSRSTISNLYHDRMERIDYTTLSKGFQTSVNIAFDLHDDSKLRTFIPTMSSIDIVEEVLHSINSPNQSRARLLVGAYGRGKSHIILVLMSLLFKKDKTLFDVPLKKMNELNPKLYEYTLEYLNSDKKLLPVIVSGNSASLTQSFLNALQQTLKNENLDDIMPGVAINSRSKLIGGLLENELSTNLGLTGTGQDVSIMRSTLVQTGILQDEMNKPVITLTPDDDKIRTVLAVIDDFLRSANSKGRNFKELYDTLTLPKNGYGIKRALYPFSLRLFCITKRNILSSKTRLMK